eukprot:5772039-Pleurochrysis_carterae.AAC.5
MPAVSLSPVHSLPLTHSLPRLFCLMLSRSRSLALSLFSFPPVPSLFSPFPNPNRRAAQSVRRSLGTRSSVLRRGGTRSHWVGRCRAPSASRSSRRRRAG